MQALIDGDVVIYAAGFASDAAAKRVVQQQIGDSKEAWEEYVAIHGVPHEPLNYCLHSVNEKVASVMDAVDGTRRRIFLSHPVNFRESWFPDYKMNRDLTHKPFWYDEIKDYLIDKMGAEYSELGDEADDALGIAQMEALKRGRDTIICTNDKDLDMIPGLHYNWSKSRVENGVYEVDEVEAIRFFYTQLITGDSTDNIPGLFKHTGKKATAAIKAPIQTMYSEAEMYHYVVKEVYKGDRDFVCMIAPLLWIKRSNELWQPPMGGAVADEEASSNN